MLFYTNSTITSWCVMKYVHMYVLVYVDIISKYIHKAMSERKIELIIKSLNHISGYRYATFYYFYRPIFFVSCRHIKFLFFRIIL